MGPVRETTGREPGGVTWLRSLSGFRHFSVRFFSVVLASGRAA